MRRDLVENRGWITEEEYDDGLAIAAACPGPLVFQLAIYCGYLRFGVLGGVGVAFVFALTPFFIVVTIAHFYTRFAATWQLRGLFYGIAPVVVALILRACWHLGQRTLRRDPVAWIFFLSALGLTVILQRELTATFLVAGVLGMFVFPPARPPRPAEPAGPPDHPPDYPPDRPPGQGIALPAVAAALPWAGINAKLFFFFFKAGLFMFGSGLVIVPFLKTYVVDQYHWASNRQFLDAVAIGLISPGPVAVAATFIAYLMNGFSGAVRRDGGDVLPLGPVHRRRLADPAPLSGEPPAAGLHPGGQGGGGRRAGRHHLPGGADRHRRPVHDRSGAGDPARARLLREAPRAADRRPGGADRACGLSLDPARVGAPLRPAPAVPSAKLGFQSVLPRCSRMLRKLLAAALLLSALPAAAQDLKSFEARTTVHVLPNGWTFILVERHQAPVFSFSTHANVGSAQEVTGITGLAHMFEHMAFKGTESIGTTNYPEEKKAIAALETAYQAYQAERLSPHGDAGRADALFKAFKAKQAEADKFVVKNEFPDVVNREGGVFLNAFTDTDETVFFYSLPANKTELWAYLESERFLHPVFREFYEERDVVHEERRQSVEGQPIGRVLEQFQGAAFLAHPYHHRPFGYESDLQSFTLTDAEKFFRENYGPGNLVTAVVGDIHPRELIPLIDRYFGRIPARPLPPPLRTVEPPQTAEKTVILEDLSQPIYLEGYHKPADTDPEQAAYEAIDDILSIGRTSRLYRSLVRDERLVVQVTSFNGFPGNEYPNLYAIMAVPGVGVTNEQVQAALHRELERLRTEDVTDEELGRFKTRAKARLVRSLRDNQGLANRLTHNQALFGDWRELFRTIDRYDKVTKADIRKVANQTFRKENRTVAMLATQPAPRRPPALPARAEPGRREEIRRCVPTAAPREPRGSPSPACWAAPSCYPPSCPPSCLPWPRHR